MSSTPSSVPSEPTAAVVLTRDELEALIFKTDRAPVCVFGEPARFEAPAAAAREKLEHALDQFPTDGARMLPFPGTELGVPPAHVADEAIGEQVHAFAEGSYRCRVLRTAAGHHIARLQRESDELPATLFVDGLLDPEPVSPAARLDAIENFVRSLVREVLFESEESRR